MDGIHDMGGMQGFGVVEHEPEDQEPVFHHEWEGRMYGIASSRTSGPEDNIDRGRHVIECIPPGDYLSMEYYDKWYLEAAVSLIDSGMVTVGELVSGKAESMPENMKEPLPPEAVHKVFGGGLDTVLPAGSPEQYKVGDIVRSKQISPTGHTRLPRYVRGHEGRIHAYYGWHVLPDANAHGEERGEPLYSVAFRASDLWPEDGGRNDYVYLDMWESYLEPSK